MQRFKAEILGQWEEPPRIGLPAWVGQEAGRLVYNPKTLSCDAGLRMKRWLRTMPLLTLQASPFVREGDLVWLRGQD